MQLSRFDPATTAWIPTQSKRIGEDAEKVYYTVTVPGFSLWAIHGSTEPPALTFVEDNLQISRQPIGIGQFTVISVDVTNTTDGPATYFANLWVDKQINQTSQILIGAGLTQTVSFPLSIDIAGAYQIRVGSQLSQATVAGRASRRCRYAGCTRRPRDPNRRSPHGSPNHPGRAARGTNSHHRPNHPTDSSASSISSRTNRDPRV